MLTAIFPISSYATALPCTETSKVDILKIKSRILIIGELHGTNEIPAMTAAIACSILNSGKPLILGLEIPTDRQEAINSFLTSQGSGTDKAQLIASDFGKLVDGRASHAMFNLLDSMRKLRAAGAQIAVMAFDISVSNLPPPLYPNEKIWSGERDMAMARNIESRARVYPNHTLLILTGATHSWRTKGAPWDSEFESMASLLLQRLPIHVIRTQALSGGSHWGCGRPKEDGQMNCQINLMKPPTKITDKPDDDTDTWVTLDTYTASIPVRQLQPINGHRN